jgi:pimeloyl-ACP methyl ester carboxylesterase
MRFSVSVGQRGLTVGASVEQVDVGRRSIAYERAGEGPPLLLLQGFVGDARSTWGPQIDDVSDDFTVVAWDVPGAGRSSDPPESFTLPDFADCLADFVDILGLGRVHVVGLSFGGALALEFYRRHPGRVLSLVLAGAYAGWAGSLPSAVAEQRLEQSLRASRLPPAEFMATMLPTMFSAATTNDRVREFAASLTEFHPAGFRAMARACAADLRDVLPQVQVPTLLLYGDQDLRAPLSVGQALHAAIPNSKLVIMPGVGHVSSVEAAEQFNVEVRQFLRRLNHDLAQSQKSDRLP